MIRWNVNYTRLALAAVLVVGLGAPAFAKPGDHPKLDKVLNGRAGQSGTSRVIITLKPGLDASLDVKRVGGKLGRRLGLINGQAVELPNAVIRKLADSPAIQSIHFDRPTAGEMNRVAVAVGARAVLMQFGLTGAGVGVAVVDSGIGGWHDDLTNYGGSSVVRTTDGQRVSAFVDFVNGRTSRYDDNGHGTHVSGIISGNGYDSLGARAGIAPLAHIVSLKVLDREGRGLTSNVIAALDWIVANKWAHNIRVVNLSVGAAVTESFNTDPLTLATKRVVDAGVVVVAAAGNLGKNRNGERQAGGITAPGNAPWVLTVGASSHEGTVVREDDVMAGYSSRGPSAYDYAAKPDVVAPGTGIVSLANPQSLFYSTKVNFLLGGSGVLSFKPYLSLTGTSMSAPVVSGTVALMMQANPALTPNLVKAIIQYTAERRPGYSALEQGAGFLNTRGAVQMARFFRTAQPGAVLHIPSGWSRQIIWGNHRLSGGVIRPNANAYNRLTTWGATLDDDGDNIVWGTLLEAGENLVWGTVDSLSEENLVLGTVLGSDGENLVWGTSEAENLVWGTFGDENIVWGTDCGGADCENLVWGTTGGTDENLVWGTADADENLVWGTSGDIDENLVWGTSDDGENLVWGTSSTATPLYEDPEGEPVNYDQTVWESIFPADSIEVAPVAEEPTVVEPVLSTVTSTSLIGGGF